ncbi:hypothetical protein RDV78_05540 [Bacillota bacterium LX-D]|nr:hypothetical protein [Bacillota bacterium LX-D]
MYCIKCGAPTENEYCTKCNPENRQQKKKNVSSVIAISCALLVVTFFISYFMGKSVMEPLQSKADSIIEVKKDADVASKAPDVTTAETTEEVKPARPEIVTYSTYTNERFSFSMEYPSHFETAEEPANNDGRIFYSPDKKAKMTVFASYNAADETLRSLYNDEIDSHSNVTYKVKRRDWFVVSGIDGETIFYKKIMMEDDVIYTFLLECPQDEKSYYAPIIEHIVKTFKTY